MRKSRNHSFEKKLAAAVSVVNLLNTAAPIALPYVTVTRDMGAAGATTESLSDVAARALYGTAEAETTIVHSGEHLSVDVLSAGDTQTIESGGYGEVFPEEHFGPPPFSGGKNFGTQSVGNGGTGLIYTNSGTQIVEGGGSARINMNYGTQTLQPGAYGDAGTIYSNAEQTIASGARGTCYDVWGNQIISSGGTGKVTHWVYPGGTQSVMSGGKGSANVIAGGRQIISSGGMGSAAEVTLEDGGANRHGYQYIYGGTGIAALIPYGGHQEVSGGLGIVDLVSGGGDQEVMNGGTGVITTLDGGNQTIYSMGGMTASGMVETMKGGTQIVWPGCAGLVKVMSGGTQDLQNGGTGVVSTMLGGTQRISASAKGTVKTLAGGTQIIQNGGTGSVGTMAGGTVALSAGGRISGALQGYGTVSGDMNLPNAQLVASGGQLDTNALNVKSITIANGGSMDINGNLDVAQVLFATDVTGYGNLEHPAITLHGDRNKIGVMDFTSATATAMKDIENHSYYIAKSLGGSIDELQVSRNGKTATLKPYSSIELYSGHDTAMPKTSLTVGFDSVHTLEHSNGLISYKIKKTYTDATFDGAIAWNPNSAYLSLAGGNFGNAFEINLANLGFSFTDGEERNLRKGDSMSLLTGLPDTAWISRNAPASIPVASSGTNTDLSGTIKGSASVTEGVAKYTVSGVTLDKVSVKAVTGAPDMVPRYWTPSSDGVRVDTDSLNIGPGDAPYAETTILLGIGADEFFRDRFITGRYKYTDKASFSHEKNGVTLSGTWSRGVRAANGGTSLVFVSGKLTADSVAFGKMAWGTPRALPADMDCDFRNAAIDATNLMFTNLDTGLAPGSTTDLLTGADNLSKKASIAGAAHRQDFSATAANGVSFGATLAGTVSTDGDSIKYTADSVTLNNVALAGWNGTAGEVPESWTKNSAGFAVDTDNMNLHPEELASRNTNILTGSAGFFSDASLRGNNVYKENADFSSTRNGVTLSGNWSRGVVVENGGKDLVFRAGDVFVDKIALGTIPWQAGASLRPNAGIAAINYAKVDGVDTANFSIENPADAAPGKSVTLLTANRTLKDMATEAKAAYSYSPVSGVNVTGSLTGDLKAAEGNLIFTALRNEASNLSFQGVNWTGETPLMARPHNISFNGATVDASKISFMNVSSLKKGDVTTLVSNFGGAPSVIVGDKYRIGTSFEGDGHASVEWNDLVFTVESDPRAAEQTHNALMGAGAGMVVLSAGNDAIGNAAGGLGQASNTGSDGVAVYAQMGGGSTRQETGSHIDVHSWNAILALGHKNEKEKSAFEYGAFFEYGTGNYTTHNGGLRGDGSMRYTGGGLLAKWTAKHGLYVEGSLRAGSIHGETNGVLRDVNDVPYSYESDAPYWGAHIGVGRELDLGHGNTLDVYGKYFMNRRNGVGFDAGEGRYDLDALTSQILRIGARYTMKRDKWSYYGGLAYEHELDGKASGTVSNGVLSASIRGTDPTGGSLRMELGATMQPDEKSPWQLDLNVAGFAGKKRGVSGGVSVAFMF